MRRFFFTVMLVLGWAAPAVAQDLVTDLSQEVIELTPAFRGEDLFLFGAIKADAVDYNKGFDVIVIVKGSARPHVVRKKQRFFGLWLNLESRVIENVPEFFAEASTRPLSEITDRETLKNLELGINEQLFVSEYLKNSGEDLPFVEGLIRGKEKAGLFDIGTEDMKLSEKILFRADFYFPPSVPSGDYQAAAFLFQDGKLLHRVEKTIRVNQVGLERALYSLAHDNPALYGIMAILIALLAGYFAGYVTQFRKKMA